VVIERVKDKFSNHIEGVSKNSYDEVGGVNINYFNQSSEGLSIAFLVGSENLKENPPIISGDLKATPS
jgi:hypothetical protein